MTLLSVPLALLYWRTPTLFELPFLVIVGALGTLSWLCMARAFALVDASVVMPFEIRAAAVHRARRLSPVRRGADRVDLARRCRDLRLDRLHHAP
jgi:hypothetical protein